MGIWYNDFLMADDFHDKAYNQLIADLDIEKGNPSTNHYPLFQELHCRYCYIKTPHTFRGICVISVHTWQILNIHRLMKILNLLRHDSKIDLLNN